MKTELKFSILLAGLCVMMALSGSYNIYAYDLTTQYGKITGTVRDEEGYPLAGATIMPERQMGGTYASPQGGFSFNKVPAGKITLIATMVGYKSQKMEAVVPPNGEVNVDFVLPMGNLRTGTVVVTGTSTPHAIEDSPVHTEVITSKLIDAKRACNLAEALDAHTGVMIENNCNNCNFTQVRINGLDGKYSEILIDGDPVFSTMAGVYGLEQIPEEMVDQIEIVKGGGSSLYGGGAVAGVINIVQRRPLVNRMKFKYQGNSTMGADNPGDMSGIGIMDHYLSAVAEMVSDNRNSGAFIFGSIRNRKPYDRNGDGFSELGYVKSESIGSNIFHSLDEDRELSITFHHIHEKRRGGNMFDRPYHEADITEAVEAWRWGGKISYDEMINSNININTYYAFALTNRESYYGGTGGDTSAAMRSEALGAYGKTNNPLHMAGVKSYFTFGRQLLTVGMDYKTEHLEDFSVRNPEFKIDNTYTNFGIFVQDDIHILEDESLGIVLGARLDKHSEIDAVEISPRISARYEIVEGGSLRASFGRGFKPPQPFSEDLHVESLSGKQRILRNAEGLESEKSNSISAGLDYAGDLGEISWYMNLVGFYTNLFNAFAFEFDRETESSVIYKRINAGEASVYGIESNIGIRPINPVEIRFGINYKKAGYGEPNPDYGDQPGADQFIRTPDLSMNLVLNWEISDDLALNSTTKYLGPAFLPHETQMDESTGIIPLIKSDSYLVIDFLINYDLQLAQKNKLQLSFGIKNLTDAYQSDLDRGVDRDPAYIYGPSLPRTAFFGINYGW
ncbi:MAG: TonB-dependent receptor [Candidatus Kapaibacterium sp.]